MTKVKRRDPRAALGLEGMTLSAPIPSAKKQESTTLAVGVRIDRKLWNCIRQASDSLNVKPARLMAYALQWFMDYYRDHPEIIQFESKRILKP